MGTPNWLVNFPPDILAYVVWYLPGEQLWRLMTTGCTLLWYKLTLPGVVKSVTLGNDFMQFKKPPAFLNEFPSLEELILYSKYAEWWDFCGIKLNSVPSTLRKLEIGGANSPEDFFVDKEGGALNLAECLPSLESLRFPLISPKISSWTPCPKSLTELEIFCWDVSVELPLSLIHLNVSRIEGTNLSVGVKFPPGLEILHTGGIDDLDLVIPLLPSSLCDFSSRAKFESSHFCAEHFPTRSMTALRLCTTDLDSHMISLLPPSLTSLEVGDVPPSLWSSLPAKLQILGFWHLSTSTEPLKTVILPTHRICQFYTFPIHHLPRSITELSLDFGYSDAQRFWSPSPEPNLDVSSYFPQKLTAFQVTSMYLTPEISKLLPSCLTEALISNLCEQVCEHLPNRITELNAEFTLVTPNLIKFLPKSLTYVDLTCVSPQDAWYDYSTGELIDHEQIGISTDEFGSPTGSYSLPSSITHLELHSLSDIGDSFMMNQKLPYLDQLHVNSGNFSDLSIPLLNVHLTVLDLSSSSRVSGKSFPFLPRGLTWLELNSSELIFDSDIQHLPKTLETLYINSAIHLSEQCIPDLPRHLRYLNLEKNCNFQSSCFPRLPYPLRSYQYYKNVVFSNWYASFGHIEVD